MALQTWEFEKPVVELENQIEALRVESAENPAAANKVKDLEKQLDEVRTKVYGSLTAWHRVLISRHPMRPRSMDYIKALTTDWHEIKGDRGFRDDEAIICGMARFNGEPIMVIGQQRGKDTKENLAFNFGMVHPEGYRKALRVMRMAERFSLPILIFIDTPGAYPGIGAEERGQAEAIARNIMEMFSLRTPIMGIVIGEGASGGALGIGVLDHVMMMENSWYCVISPEGCASILWRDSAMAPRAAEAMKLSAQDLMELRIIDEIIPEPTGGAHRDPTQAIENVRAVVTRELKRLSAKDIDALLSERYEKYRQMGVFEE